MGTDVTKYRRRADIILMKIGHSRNYRTVQRLSRGRCSHEAELHGCLMLPQMRKDKVPILAAVPRKLGCSEWPPDCTGIDQIEKPR